MWMKCNPASISKTYSSILTSIMKLLSLSICCCYLMWISDMYWYSVECSLGQLSCLLVFIAPLYWYLCHVTVFAHLRVHLPLQRIIYKFCHAIKAVWLMVLWEVQRSGLHDIETWGRIIYKLQVRRSILSAGSDLQSFMYFSLCLCTWLYNYH